eukprot:2922999-Rhodomonas_salina.2
MEGRKEGEKEGRREGGKERRKAGKREGGKLRFGGVEGAVGAEQAQTHHEEPNHLPPHAPTVTQRTAAPSLWPMDSWRLEGRRSEAEEKEHEKE